MSKYDKIYAKTIAGVLVNGYEKPDRTKVGTYEDFGVLVDYGQISKADFPLLTVKQVPFKSVLSELLWFLEGSSSERRLAEILYNKERVYLKDKKTIWTENAQADYWGKEDLGNVYGKMWRSWPTSRGSTLDQIDQLIYNLKVHPFTRRHLVTAWNPGEQKPSMVALPPCHYAFQFNVRPDNTLDLLVQMRSNDKILGAPFNIASYALLQLMIAQVTGYTAGQLKFCIGSAHIYTNHLHGACEILRRIIDKETFDSPSLIIDPDIKYIDDFKMSSFELTNYQSCPKISLPMAV